jgi:membrane protease YdiL (CAAX protease family)
MTWLFVGAALTFETLPDQTSYGVIGHAAALLYALAALFWLGGSYGLAFDWADRRSRRALIAVVSVLGGLFIVCVVLLRTGVVSSFGAARASARETLIFQFVLVAVEEELVWRGFVHSFLDEKLPGRVRFLGAELGWGALLSALAFALLHNLHVQLDPLGLAVSLQPQILNALIFVYLRAYTGSIWPSVAAHGLWNGLGNLLNFL